MNTQWIPFDIATGVHKAAKRKAESVSETHPADAALGLYMAMIDTLPDTPENRGHLEAFIRRNNEDTN